MRGKFELTCELTAPAGREIRVVYGGHVLGLKADLKNLERSQTRPADARRRHHAAHGEGGRMVYAASWPWTAAG